MVREGKMLAWDKDIDVAIWDGELPKIKKAIAEFHKKGISVHFTESGHVTFNLGNEHISAMVYRKNDKALRYTFTHMRKFQRTEDGVIHRKTLDTITQLLKYIRWLLLKPIYIGDSPRLISKKMQNAMLKIIFVIPNPIRQSLLYIIEAILTTGCNYFTEEVPSRFFTDLKYIDFYGMKVKAPSDKEGYLEHKYGKDWRIPNKNYIYYQDSKAERIIT